MNFQKGLWQRDLGSAWPKFTQHQSGINPEKCIYFYPQCRQVSQSVTRQYSAPTFNNASETDHVAYPLYTNSPRQHGNLVKNIQSQYSVFGVGQGMVDYSFQVDAADLQHCNAIEGGRRTISSQEAGQLLQYFKSKGHEIKGSGGGSLNNTMVLLTHLRSATSHFTHPQQPQSSYDINPLNFMGMVNSNFYNQYYPDLPLSDHIRAISPWKQKGNLTVADPTQVTKNEDPISGTVIVLVSEKGERSFLSDPNFGMQNFQITDEMIQQLQRSKWLFIEGYMLEHKEVVENLDTLLAIAKDYGVAVALSAGDVSIVNKAASQFWRILTDQKNDGSPLVDVLFANAVEGQALVSHAPGYVLQEFGSCANGLNVGETQELGEADKKTELTQATVLSREQLHSHPAAQASAYLANFASIVSITHGSSGSYISQQEAQPTRNHAQVFPNDINQMEALDWYEAGASNVFNSAPLPVKGSHVITTAIPPAPADVVVDTCGAGDAYAAGFLFALMTQQDAVLDIAKLQNVGTFAAEVAAVVVGLSGTLPKWGCADFQRLTQRWKEEQFVWQQQQQQEIYKSNCRLATQEQLFKQTREQLDQERLQLDQEKTQLDEQRLYAEQQRQAEELARLECQQQYLKEQTEKQEMQLQKQQQGKRHVLRYIFALAAAVRMGTLQGASLVGGMIEGGVGEINNKGASGNQC